MTLFSSTSSMCRWVWSAVVVGVASFTAQVAGFRCGFKSFAVSVCVVSDCSLVQCFTGVCYKQAISGAVDQLSRCFICSGVNKTE